MLKLCDKIFFIHLPGLVLDTKNGDFLSKNRKVNDKKQVTQKLNFDILLENFTSL